MPPPAVARRRIASRHRSLWLCTFALAATIGCHCGTLRSARSRAVAHARTHDRDARGSVRWEAFVSSAPALPGIQQFEVVPQINDAPGRHVFVAGSEVFCDAEPDVLDRLVRALGGVEKATAIGDGWVDVVAGTFRLSSSVERDPTRLSGGTPEVQRAPLSRRIPRPSFERLASGGFRVRFAFLRVTSPPMDDPPRLVLTATIGADGHANTELAPLFPLAVRAEALIGKGPLHEQHVQINARATVLAGCLAELPADVPIEAVPRVQITIDIGRDGHVAAATRASGPEGAYAECLRATLATRTFGSADAPTNATLTLSGARATELE